MICFPQAEEIVATEEESLGRHTTSSTAAVMATTDSDDYDDDDFDSDDEDIDVDVDGDEESVISELVRRKSTNPLAKRFLSAGTRPDTGT